MANPFVNMSFSPGTVITSSWLNGINDTVKNWLTVYSYGAVGNGVANDTAAVQAAINVGGMVIFPPGQYNIQGDLTYNSNTFFWIQRGAVVTVNAGRITCATATVTGVTFWVDGELSSTNLPNTSPQKFSWPLNVGGVPTTSTYERGFIEFGGASSTTRTAGGLFVGGSGKIHGDWTGTQNITDWSQFIQRKGICSWFCDNVNIQDIEVYGFQGEAVYHYDNGSSGQMNNINFRDLYVHDVNFNALNFNTSLESRNCYIRDNEVFNCYQGIELSGGIACNNSLRQCAGYGIITGGGTVATVVIRDNFIEGTTFDGISAYAAPGNTGTGYVEITNNILTSIGGTPIIADYIAELTITGNSCRIYASRSGSYGTSVGSNTANAEIVGNKYFAPGGGLITPVHNTSPRGYNANNYWYDTLGSSSPLFVSNQSNTLQSTQVVDYKILDGAASTGLGHTTVYKLYANTLNNPITYFVKTYSSIDTVGASGASGSWHIATKKTSSESATLSDTMVFDQNGNTLNVGGGGLGYGAGSGGTVTQLNTKGDPVTLNTPTGKITMNNAALAANAVATFTFNNSIMGSNDVLVVSIANTSPNGSSYRAWGTASASGAIFVQNISGGSLSDAVVLNFAVIKGSNV